MSIRFDKIVESDKVDQTLPIPQNYDIEKVKILDADVVQGLSAEAGIDRRRGVYRFRGEYLHFAVFDGVNQHVSWFILRFSPEESLSDIEGGVKWALKQRFPNDTFVVKMKMVGDKVHTTFTSTKYQIRTPVYIGDEASVGLRMYGTYDTAPTTEENMPSPDFNFTHDQKKDDTDRYMRTGGNFTGMWKLWKGTEVKSNVTVGSAFINKMSVNSTIDFLTVTGEGFTSPVSYYPYYPGFPVWSTSNRQMLKFPLDGLDLTCARPSIRETEKQKYNNYTTWLEVFQRMNTFYPGQNQCTHFFGGLPDFIDEEGNAKTRDNRRALNMQMKNDDHNNGLFGTNSNMTMYGLNYKGQCPELFQAAFVLDSSTSCNALNNAIFAYDGLDEVIGTITTGGAPMTRSQSLGTHVSAAAHMGIVKGLYANRGGGTYRAAYAKPADNTPKVFFGLNPVGMPSPGETYYSTFMQYTEEIKVDSDPSYPFAGMESCLLYAPLSKTTQTNRFGVGRFNWNKDYAKLPRPVDPKQLGEVERTLLNRSPIPASTYDHLIEYPPFEYARNILVKDFHHDSDPFYGKIAHAVYSGINRSNPNIRYFWNEAKYLNMILPHNFYLFSYCTVAEERSNFPTYDYNTQISSGSDWILFSSDIPTDTHLISTKGMSAGIALPYTTEGFGRYIFAGKFVNIPPRQADLSTIISRNIVTIDPYDQLHTGEITMENNWLTDLTEIQVDYARTYNYSSGDYGSTSYVYRCNFDQRTPSNVMYDVQKYNIRLRTPLPKFTGIISDSLESSSRTNNVVGILTVTSSGDKDFITSEDGFKIETTNHNKLDLYVETVQGGNALVKITGEVYSSNL